MNISYSINNLLQRLFFPLNIFNMLKHSILHTLNHNQIIFHIFPNDYSLQLSYNHNSLFLESNHQLNEVLNLIWQKYYHVFAYLTFLISFIFQLQLSFIFYRFDLIFLFSYNDCQCCCQDFYNIICFVEVVVFLNLFYFLDFLDQ